MYSFQPRCADVSFLPTTMYSHFLDLLSRWWGKGCSSFIRIFPAGLSPPHCLCSQSVSLGITSSSRNSRGKCCGRRREFQWLSFLSRTLWSHPFFTINSWGQDWRSLFSAGVGKASKIILYINNLLDSFHFGWTGNISYLRSQRWKEMIFFCS